METVLIKAIAEELGILKEYALRLAKKKGFDIYYGKRNVASVSKEDADKLIREYEPKRSSNRTDSESAARVGVGYFYLIQLIPEEMPDRIKIGYTDSIQQRLSDHRVTNPTLKLLKSWPCKRTWDHAVMDSITRKECTHIGGEVYEGEVVAFIERADAFFALMPTVSNENC